MSLVKDVSPPKDYAELRDAINRKYESLSTRLKQIAKFALDHPTHMAMDTISSIAKDAGVQPSAIIRFANAFGYSGFSEMQRPFQAHVTKRSANYKERVRVVLESDESPDNWSNKELLKRFCAANILALESLENSTDGRSLGRAITLLRNAERIFIAGQRRSYPVATFLVYVLNHSQCRAHLLDGQGGLLMEQLSTICKKDVLLAITFHPYAEETRNSVAAAIDVGAKVILITDSGLNPMAEKANVCLYSHDGEVLTFRSLTSSMCLAQSLATALVLRTKSSP